MNYMVNLLSFVSGLCLGMFLFFRGLREQVSLRVYGETGPERASKKKRKSVLRRFLRLLAPLNRRLMRRAYCEKTAARLSKVKSGLSALEFFALKELFMIGMPLAVYLAIDRLDPLWMAALAGLGFFIPDLWLRKQQRKRKNLIIKSLPEVIDLLSLCVSAGLDFMLAVRWVVEKSRYNPLIDELKGVLQEIKVGKSRREALKDMSHKLDIPDVSSFVRTLIQADRIGTPVSETLAIIAEDCRMRRFRRGERLALQAPMKMLIPLIFCILPTVAIIVGGPVFLQFMQTGLKF